MKSKHIRAKFLEFFKSKQHSLVSSAPLVSKGDSSLMFINSGMAPFKEYFLGNATPVSNRIANSQKCLRVSGKHNDLEEVGYDTYHHTMFEMLGNWSFGNYFKEQAITWAWQLLTEVYKIDKDLLYISVFEGDDKQGTSMDKEAYNFWKQIVAEKRIVLGNKENNFWEMGEQGPCGPCSEIHIDIRSDKEKAKVDGKSLVNANHPQVIEIWNLVFMQYNRRADGSLEELPLKHIDTGMGFERLCMVLQNVQSNYDTDLFIPLIKEIESITGCVFGEQEKTDIAIRVIADHIRAVAFAIADGQLPSNNGAGYVIRRILRRAVRYGFTFLNQKEPFIYKLNKTLSEQMSDAFPELKKHESLVNNVIKEEELSFLRTLDQGLLLLNRVIERTKGKLMSGKEAFELYDTYGFPLDLTQLIAREKGYAVNQAAFSKEMKVQKNRSRAKASEITTDWFVLNNQKGTQFIGYDSLTAKVQLTRYRELSVNKQKQYQLVFNKTPFYPEGGGQVGDIGFLKNSKGSSTKIVNTKKENNLIVHFADSLPENIHEPLNAIVDKEHRKLTSCNHSATHLLHQALRVVLGKHVEQKGSLVGRDYLRFDFSHFSKTDSSQLQKIEAFVNARIAENICLKEQRNITMQQAINQGALALFGEKYGTSVRTVRFGESIELCGGTHILQTGNIWYFKIISESAIATGIRRIEAITGSSAEKYFRQMQINYNSVKELLKNPKNILKAVTNLQDENARLKKQIENLLKDKVKSLKEHIKSKLQLINGVYFLAAEVDLDSAGLKNLSFEIGKEFENLFLVLTSALSTEKAVLSCYISKNLIDNRGYNASKVVKELGLCIGGGGGGQNFFATAGGKDPSGISEALKKARQYI
ncbi:MAG: alanine--tRNA ligase [Tenacibaculum sp.]